MKFERLTAGEERNKAEIELAKIGVIAIDQVYNDN